MKILHVTPSYYPAMAWGGPIWSTKAICDGVHAATGCKLRVLTTDAAGPDPTARVTPVPLPYPTHYERRVSGHSVSPGLLARLPLAIRWADVVHLTGTYSFPTLPTLMLARMLDRPVVWSPRGALQATADWDDAPRRGVKRAFEHLAHWVRPAETVLHVTSRREADQSVARLGDIQPVVIPNAVDVPARIEKTPHDETRILFLSRLHPKKGIENLIAAMASLPDHFHLDICGDGDPHYVRYIKNFAATLGGRATFHGMVNGAAKQAAFARADVFVLPSHSENFGIAIAEALAHGVPVLTTKATPWTGLEANRCGRCIDLDRADLAHVIADMAGEDLRAMGQHGRDWMRRDFAPQVMVQSFVDLYRGCLPDRSDPVLA